MLVKTGSFMEQSHPSQMKHGVDSQQRQCRQRVLSTEDTSSLVSTLSPIKYSNISYNSSKVGLATIIVSYPV